MYRQWRYMPEVNRTCCRASYERGYNAHLDALRRIRGNSGTMDTGHPKTPTSITRRQRQYEGKKQKNWKAMSGHSQLEKGVRSSGERRSHLPAFLDKRTKQQPPSRDRVTRNDQPPMGPKANCGRHRTMFDD